MFVYGISLLTIFENRNGPLEIRQPGYSGPFRGDEIRGAHIAQVNH